MLLSMSSRLRFWSLKMLVVGHPASWRRMHSGLVLAPPSLLFCGFRSTRSSTSFTLFFVPTRLYRFLESLGLALGSCLFYNCLQELYAMLRAQGDGCSYESFLMV